MIKDYQAVMSQLRRAVQINMEAEAQQLKLKYEKELQAFVEAWAAARRRSWEPS